MDPSALQTAVPAPAAANEPTDVNSAEFKASFQSEGVETLFGNSPPPASASDTDSSDDEDGIQFMGLTGDQEADRALLSKLMASQEDKLPPLSETTLMTANEKAPEPIAPLETLTLPKEEKLVLLGAVMCVMDNALTLEGEMGSRAVDPGTLVILDDHSVVGRVEDVFGPVGQPFYSLRMHPTDFVRLQSMFVEEETKVYFSETKTTYAVPDTRKGCDASNFYDEEVPVQDQEFSDDEAETLARQAKKAAKKKSSNNTRNVYVVPPTTSKPPSQSQPQPAVQPQLYAPQHAYSPQGFPIQHGQQQSQQYVYPVPPQMPYGQPLPAPSHQHYFPQQNMYYGQTPYYAQPIPSYTQGNYVPQQQPYVAPNQQYAPMQYAQMQQYPVSAYNNQKQQQPPQPPAKK